MKRINDIVKNAKRIAKRAGQVLAVPVLVLPLYACNEIEDVVCKNPIGVLENNLGTEQLYKNCDEGNGKSDGDGNGDEKTNHVPTAYVTGPDFGNGYSGFYTVQVGGEDEDGDPLTIYASVNGGEWEQREDGEPLELPIAEGDNLVDAYTDDGKEESGTASMQYDGASGFYSPKEVEARTRIYSRLSATNNGGINGGYTGPNQTEYGASGVFADFIVEPLPVVPSGEVIIEYCGENDNLSQEMNDKAYFDANSIPNLYMNKLPPEEIDSRLNRFIDDNWQ